VIEETVLSLFSNEVDLYAETFLASFSRELHAVPFGEHDSRDEDYFAGSFLPED
jgi:hypothetical protein